jgi:hypothetical protein
MERVSSEDVAKTSTGDEDQREAFVVVVVLMQVIDFSHR